MQPNDPTTSEEDVLLSFSVEPDQGPETLERYLKLYPEYKEALVECAVEMASMPQEISPVWVSDEEVDGAWHRFKNEVEAERESLAKESFRQLSAESFKDLALRLGINSLLLVRIRDKGILAASIPAAFIRQLAAELGAPLESVMSYLDGPATLGSSSRFRSSKKPTAGDKLDFETAVKSSKLTPDQESALLALKD